MLTTFATEEIGETPSSPCFVRATPIPIKNRQAIKSKYRLKTSFLVTKSLFSAGYHRFAMIFWKKSAF